MIPKKNTRKINVSGTTYRWSATFGKSRLMGDSGPSLRLIIQPEEGGRVFVTVLLSTNWKSEHEDYGGHKASLTPGEVRLFIERALQEGWSPATTKGRSFRLRNFATPDWECS